MLPEASPLSPNQPWRIGLTGGIGSGKSRVADQLAELGAAIIDTDLIAHSLTRPGGPAIAPLRALFGAEVIGADGAMDRAAMRELAFQDPLARRKLENLLHPMIATEVQMQASRSHGHYQVFVVPLLVESGRWQNRVNRVCVVDCDEATQIERVGRRSGLEPDAVRRIMAVQASREQRLAAADDLILNDGNTTPEALAQRVRDLHEQWLMQLRDWRRGMPK